MPRPSSCRTFPRRLASALLAAALACGLIPAAAFGAGIGQADASEAARAATVDELLAAGDYREGAVVLEVTAEFDEGPTTFALSSTTASSLFSFDAPVQARAASAVRADGGNGDAADATAPARVVLVESERESTRELLLRYLDAPGVIAAEPDYLFSLPATGGEDAGSGAFASDGATGASAAAADDASGETGADTLAALLDGDDARAASPVEGAGEPSDSTDPLLAEQWQLFPTTEAAGGTNAQELWEKLGYASSDGVPESDERVVAVIDSGTTLDHPDLQGILWDGGNSQGVNAAFNAAMGEASAANSDFGLFAATDGFSGDPEDGLGHGTHVAGIIAAELGNGEGGAGIAPNARIMTIRTIEDGAAGMSESAVIVGYAYIQAACRQGVDVVAVNNSWGAACPSPIYSDIMNELYERYGVLSVCAASNDSIDNDVFPMAPTNDAREGVVSVASIDEDGGLSFFSDYGATSVDLGAPGGQILSTSWWASASYDIDQSAGLLVKDQFAGDSLFSVREYGEADGFAPTTAMLSPQANFDGQSQGDGVLWTREASADGIGEPIAVGLSSTSLAGALDAGGASVDDVDAIAMRLSLSDGGSGLAYGIWAQVKAEDGEWLTLEPSGGLGVFEGKQAVVGFGVSDDVRARIDWDNFEVRLTRSIVESIASFTLTFRIDDVSLLDTRGNVGLVPYVSMNGTSMATPAVTGAVALLSAAYPEASPHELRDLLLGCTSATDALYGKTTTDGQLDLSRSDNPRPVICGVEQDGSDPTLVTVSGAFLGEGPGTAAVEGAEGVEVLSWSDGEVRLRLPEGLTAAARYVSIERDDGESARLRAPLTATAEGGTGVFEDLAAPDLRELGVSAPVYYSSWSLAAAGGSVYAAPGGIVADDGLPLLLRYDIASGAWSRDTAIAAAAADAGLAGIARIEAAGDALVILDSAGSLFRYEPSGAGLSRVAAIDPDALGFPQLAEGMVYAVDYASMAITGDSATVAGIAVYDSAAGTLTATPYTVVADLSTGEMERGPDLAVARYQAAACAPEGVFTMAGGVDAAPYLYGFQTTGAQRLVDGAFSPVASLPDSTNAGSAPATAAAVNPDGVKVRLADGTSKELVRDSMVVSGLATYAQDGIGSGPDTYLYDADADEWFALSERLSLTATVYGGAASVGDGSQEGDGLYVIAGSQHEASAADGQIAFKYLAYERASEPAPEPGPDAPDPTPGAEPGGEAAVGLPGAGGGTVAGGAMAETGDATGAVGGIAAGAAIAAAGICAVGGASLARRRTRL